MRDAMLFTRALSFGCPDRLSLTAYLSYIVTTSAKNGSSSYLVRISIMQGFSRLTDPAMLAYTECRCGIRWIISRRTTR